MTLTTPTPEQAKHFTRMVEPGQAFLATIMSPSSGARGVPIMQLARAEQFLDGHSFNDYQAAGYRMDIHYADFGALSQWLGEVVGDEELAGAIAALHETGEVFGVLAPQVKALLAERLGQCQESLNTTDASDGSHGEAQEPAGRPDATERTGDDK